MQQRAITLTLIALVAMPGAAATWSSYGTYEPDTIYDETGLMQTEPNEDRTKKEIYFNVYPTAFPMGTSINSGTLGSRVQQAGAQNFNAILGPWIDCNGDGYVGFRESALIVYPSSALLNTSICPADPDNIHNDGRWVYEYVPIGYQPEGCGGTCDTPPLEAHVRIIEDRDARVWGDIGRPGDQQAQTCPISPFPHGTTSGSGWLVRYVDCFIARKGTEHVNILSQAVDPENQLGLYFYDRHDPQKSNSTLNQHFPESLFGNPETGETGTMQLDSDEDGGEREHAFTTWDCSGRAAEVRDNVGFSQSIAIVTIGTRGVVVHDPTFDGEESILAGNYGKFDENFTDANGNYAWVARPAPAVIDPTDSVADGLNATARGVRVGGGDDDHDAASIGGDCDTVANDDDGDNTYSDVHQDAFFRLDAPFEPGGAAKKDVDDYFYFYNGCEQEATTAAVLGESAPSSLVSTPPTQFIGGLNCADPIWQSNTLWATTPQSINRNTLMPSQAAYWTFYARIGASTFASGYDATGASGTYGSEACGSFTTGVRNGWDCDPSHWYTDSNYHPIQDQGTHWQGKVGFTYHARDVDCYDGTLARGSGVRASLIDVGDAFDPVNPDPNNDYTPCRDALG